MGVQWEIKLCMFLQTGLKPSAVSTGNFVLNSHVLNLFMCMSPGVRYLCQKDCFQY